MASIAETMIAAQRAVDVANGSSACRSCGCTPNAACVGGCAWLDDDLCTSCAVVVALSPDELDRVRDALNTRIDQLPADDAVRLDLIAVNALFATAAFGS